MLHFKKTSWQSSFLPSGARFGFMMRPLWLKMRSTGAEVAGTDNTLSRSGCRLQSVERIVGFHCCPRVAVVRHCACFNRLEVFDGCISDLDWRSGNIFKLDKKVLNK